MLKRVMAEKATVLMVGLAIISTISPGRASTIVGGFTVIDTFNFLVDRQSNDVGLAVGPRETLGLDVTPVGCEANCTGPATTVTASQGSVNLALGYQFSPALPDEFAINIGVPALTGAWTLSLRNPSVNGGVVATTTTAPLGTATAPAFVGDVSVVESGLTPTVNWSVAPSSKATDETFYIWDRSIVTPDGHPIVYTSSLLPATQTSFTIPNGVLVANHNYTFAIQQEVRSSGALISRSQSFADFVQDNSLPPGTVLKLPVVVIDGKSPVYNFNFPIGPGQIYYLDPPVTAGYLYKIGAGNPLFASVSLPSLGASISYTLCLPEASAFACDVPLTPGETYDFLGSGVSSFEVLLGGADLDPLAGLPFVTAVSFEGAGAFTGSITTLVANVSEPADIAIWSLALPGLLVVRARRKMPAAQL